jgi:D-hydroxyproline dehydrogenase subunit gamma
MTDPIEILVNGRAVRVPPGTLIAAAIALAGGSSFRRSVRGQSRGPLCGMGICFECRVTVNGEPHQRSCLTFCEPGMRVEVPEPSP